MAFVPDPIHNLGWLAFYGFLVNLFSSIQDLAASILAEFGVEGFPHRSSEER